MFSVNAFSVLILLVRHQKVIMPLDRFLKTFVGHQLRWLNHVAIKTVVV